ncbi:hypothetical protein DFH08DRAFT_808610 [Mycena albidolilacea]|uniref:Uncharacterized protein n=1 Tax=Mycena albidolilacea TaxID=1033008 RepID=A0AAD7EQZ0_9AGAR|nr:hypothetical protein DFH08DRAFT_808610 [Mycena albidolilacea]
MPETCKSEASYLVLKHVFASFTDKGTCMALKSIEINATDKECSCLPKDHPAQQGLLYVVNSSSTVKGYPPTMYSNLVMHQHSAPMARLCIGFHWRVPLSTIKRGINKSQTYVYPQTGGKAKSNMPVGVLTDLSLKGVSYTHQGLVLNLGPLTLMCQVQWLTHTSVQLYSCTGYEHLGSASEDVFTQSLIIIIFALILAHIEQVLILMVTVLMANYYVLNAAVGFVIASIAWNIWFKFIS